MKLDAVKKLFPEGFTLEMDFLDETIKKLNLPTDAKVLDIGTGYGIMAILLALNGLDVLTGQPEVDQEWDQLKEELGENTHHDEHHHHETGSDWKESAKKAGINHKIKFQYLDAERLSFSAESFDGVFLYDALQHIKNREVALSECLRVTKPSGSVCAIETNKKGIEYYQKMEGFTIDYIDPRDLLEPKTFSTEVFTGKLVNAYVVRKI